MEREDRLAILAGIGVFLTLLGLVWYLTVNTVSCSEMCEFALRKHEPAHWYHYTTRHCWSRDKNGNCTFATYTNHKDWIPDKWYVTYRDSYGGLDAPFQVAQDFYNNPDPLQRHTHSRWKKCPPGGKEY